MLGRVKEDIMSNDAFAASQQWMGFWKKAAGEHMERLKVASEEWAKIEGKGLEQAGTMVDEMSKLAKESFAYTGQLAAEWRKLSLHAIEKGASALSADETA
jgi:hypothetical protein